MHLDKMFANNIGYCRRDVKWKVTTGGTKDKDAMKHRNTQFGVRKNPDSPRVHGLRLTVDSSSQSKPSLQAESFGLPSAGGYDL
jgi:hypothetical protein